MHHIQAMVNFDKNGKRSGSHEMRKTTSHQHLAHHITSIKFYRDATTLTADSPWIVTRNLAALLNAPFGTMMTWRVLLS